MTSYSTLALMQLATKISDNSKNLYNEVILSPPLEFELKPYMVDRSLTLSEVEEVVLRLKNWHNYNAQINFFAGKIFLNVERHF